MGGGGNNNNSVSQNIQERTIEMLKNLMINDDLKISQKNQIQTILYDLIEKKCIQEELESLNSRDGGDNPMLNLDLNDFNYT